MTNGCDSEKVFLENITKKNDIKVIFDVGSCDESMYIESDAIVHYFDPYEPYIDKLKKQKPNNNKKSFFNVFGLSDSESTMDFYPNTYSLVKRPMSSNQKVSAIVRRGDDYMKENSIDEIDFLKIDVECMETFVFRGFGERLKDVKIIQFEYGIGQAEVGDNLNIMLSYLENYGFYDFYYMYHGIPGLVKITSKQDTWSWCNIVSYNSKYFDTVPWE